MKISKDYGNSCLNYCVLHLFRHKTVAFQKFTILFLPFPSLFSLIITIFAISELPQNYYLLSTNFQKQPYFYAIFSTS